MASHRFALGRCAALVLGALLLVALPAAAQSQAEPVRLLAPGESAEGVLDADNLAQVFTIQSAAAGTVSLTVTNNDGMALVMLLTSALGTPLAQAVDDSATGTLTLTAALSTSGLYYVTVFPAPGVAAPVSGVFTLALAEDVSGAAAVAAPTVFPSTAATPEVTAPLEPTPGAEELGTFLATEEVATAATFTARDVLTTNGIQVSLTWNTTVDLDLEVRDPVGGSLYWSTPEVASGGFFETPNINGVCETFTANAPTEALSWPPGAVPVGSYEVLVYYQQDCENNGPVDFTVTASVNGVPMESVVGTLLPQQVYLAAIEVDDAAVGTVRDGGVNTNGLPAPAAEILRGGEPIAVGSSVEGLITNADAYDSYTFDGSLNDVITLTHVATSGSLDPFVFLMDANGTVVASNDDDEVLGTVDSALRNVRLPRDGRYTIVATRYGQQLGGTEGNYLLELTGATANVAADLVDFDLPAGIIEVTLYWNTSADVQLLVRDPAGNAVFDDTPRIPSGGILFADGNVNCRPRPEVGLPVSYIYWPPEQRVRPGTYEIDVWYQDTCNDNTPVDATLAVAIGGQLVFVDPVPTPVQGDHYVTTFTIGVDGVVTRGPGGLIGGSETITNGELSAQYTEKLAAAQALTSNAPVTGTISDQNRFDVYTFEGQTGEVVSIRMERTAGTLDTLLFLLGPNGVQLAVNDDAEPGVTTDSLISQFTLPAAGQYIVLATHYATIYGGTNGTYNLLFSRLN